MGHHKLHVVAQCTIKNRTLKECDATGLNSNSTVWLIIKNSGIKYFTIYKCRLIKKLAIIVIDKSKTILTLIRPKSYKSLASSKLF